jgi:cytidyltransferase-like protein
VRVLRDLTEADRRGPGAVVTIGVYDGVHRGHVEVLRLVRELADARGLDAVCVTFDRHPAEVVRPESAPKQLTTLEQRLELLDATGYLDTCLVLTFDETRSKEPAEDFVREVLVEGFRARLVVVGADFHFGYRRGGNVPLLERMGAEFGFGVVGLGLVAADEDPTGEPYSSTRIRELLAIGEVAAAARLLGRTKSGAPSRSATGGAASSGIPPPTSPFPTGSACPPTASTPGRWSTATARSDRQPCRWVRARRSTRTWARRCSRPTCSTSTATSTAST